MEAKLLLYTADGCAACGAMTSALERLGAGYTNIKVTNGMAVPPDVNGLPTLAIERDGQRSTVCTGWPGSDETFGGILNSFSVPLKGEKQ